MTLAALLLFACNDDQAITPRFDGPAGAAVLEPGSASPFDGPVGFVVGARDGRVSVLDLENDWRVADSAIASFAPAAPVALGAARTPGDVAVFGDGARVTLFVADLGRPVLVEAPYLTGLDAEGVPQRPAVAVAGAATFDDVDGSGDAVQVWGVRLREGATTTETWTFTSNGTDWEARGSRSGLQSKRVVPQVPWSSDRDELALLLDGAGSSGDVVSLGTDTGVVEHAVQGVVQALHLDPFTGWLLVSTLDAASGVGALIVWDPAGGASLGAIPLPEGAVPWRITGDGAGRAWVADARAATVYELTLGPTPDATGVVALEQAAPLHDLAYVEGDAYQHLFVAPSGLNRLDLYDVGAAGWRDVNLLTSEIDGIPLDGPVTGLAASKVPVLLENRTNEAGLRQDYLVAVSLFSGQLVFAEGETGCLALDSVGPYATLADPFFSDGGATSDPEMEDDGATNRPIQLATCGGLVRDETWAVTYDGVAAEWLVEGGVSGLQEGAAREEVRYLSDGGGLSFLIHSGLFASSTGDRFGFSTVSGVVRASGDLDGDGSAERSLDAPARPVLYTYPPYSGNSGWDSGLVEVKALWPVTNSDIVLKVDASTGRVEGTWE